MFTFRSIYTLLFLVGIFFLPFNEFTGLSFLGEYANDAPAYFFLVGSVFLCIEMIYNRKAIVPFSNVTVFFLSAFLLWTIISSLLNLNNLQEQELKGIGGINRFIRQFISVFISLVLFFYFYINALRKWDINQLFYRLRKVLLLSFIFVFGYGMLEVFAVHFGMGFLMPIIKLFSYFPFYEFPNLLSDRISSVSFEAPFLAIFLITVAGWMFSYIITEKGLLRFAPTLGVLILTYYSDSRTALIIILFQLGIFVLELLRRKEYRKYLLIFGSIILFAGVAFLTSSKGADVAKEISEKIERLDFSKNLLENVSNKSRFGMQYAQFKVFKDHPFIGVGLGQQAYYSKYYYPPWAVTNNYEFALNYKNPSVSSFPPGYNLYVRILAEHGVIGFLLFLALIGSALWQAFKIYQTNKKTQKILGLVLFISFAGLIINWLQIDTYRIYGFWLFIAVVYSARRLMAAQNTIENRILRTKKLETNAD